MTTDTHTHTHIWLQRLVNVKALREVVMDFRVNGSESRSLKADGAAQLGR